MTDLPNLPAIFFDGTEYVLEPVDKHSPSYFGGPSEVRISGVRHGPRALHHVMTIDTAFVPSIKGEEDEIPLFFGMCFDGCEIQYEVNDLEQKCKVTRLRPRKSSDDFPYEDYPAYLPYFPLGVKSKTACSARTFSNKLYGEVDWDSSYEIMVIVVPPIFVGHISMWGPCGNAEGVQIIFTYNFTSKVVSAACYIT